MQTPDHDPQGPQFHRRPTEGAERRQPAGEVASQLGNNAIQTIIAAPHIQRSGATTAQQLDESVARAIEDRRGQGRPLQEPVRRDMEDALGHDLSDVRIHTDSDAHDLNEAVSARAFTTGSDVFFKQGTYDPSSTSGRQLLGHELTHVVQQRAGMSGLQAGEVSDPADPAEQHAEAVGHQLAEASAPATPGRTATAPHGVARQADEEEEAAMQMSVDTTSVQRQEDEELME
jgi:hypothetical protein